MSFADYVPPDKNCSVCLDKLPLDAVHFDRDRHSADGFRDECKSCRATKRKRQDDSEIDDRLKALDRASMKMLTNISHGDYSKLPHIGEVFECLMRVFGGPQGYAQHFLGTYLTANPGSQQRVKLLSIISMMANQVTQSGAAKVPKEYLTDDDLNREIKERILSISGTVEDKDVA